MTATSPRSRKRLISSSPLMSGDARRAVRVRGQDRNLPALPGARLEAHAFEHDREQTGGHLLAGGDDGVVFARVMQGRGLARPGDELVGRARHGGDDDRDLVAGVDLALDVARDVADAVDVGDRGAAEFHHEAGHAKKRPGKAARAVHRAGAGAKRRVYIAARAGACNIGPATLAPERTD